MKFSVAALKSIEWKKLLVDHGEKIVLGIVGLGVLGALAGAPWKTESRNPEELVTKVGDAQKKVVASKWPDEQRQKYGAQSGIGEMVTKLLTPVDVAAYDYKTDIFWPIYPRQEPIREPEWFTVQRPIATGGRVILSVYPEGMKRPGSGELAAGDAGEPMPGDRPRGGEFDPNARRNETGPRGAGVGAAGPTGPGAAALPAAGPVSAGDVGIAAQGGTNSSSEIGRGARFISIRGIIPYRKQMESIARARHEPVSKAEQLLQYVDFEVERQTAVAGNDPWAGPWEPVNVQVAKKLLEEETTDFDDDVVDAAITDPVFTMPLPMRIAGYWDAWATHPDVKNYELSPEAREQERRLNEQLLEIEKDLQKSKEQQGPEAGGFSGLQKNMRKLRQDVSGNIDNFNKFNQQINMNIGANPNNQAEAKNMKAKVTAVGNLLLFRYLDFDVEPNNAYRYRVRLTLANPNFNLSPDLVVGPHVSAENKRTTAWSDVTDPVVVGEDVQYYLSKVETPRGRNQPTAQFDIFQWNPATGMPVHDEKLKAVFGQTIGGKQPKVKILAPPVSMEEKDFNFVTGDVLVDTADHASLSDADLNALHADLKLPPDLKGKSLFVDKVLVANESGDLATLDPMTQEKREKRAKDTYDAALKAWKDILSDPAEAKPASGAERLLDASQYATPMEAESKGKRGSKKKNPTRLDGAMPIDAAMPNPMPASGNRPRR